MNDHETDELATPRTWTTETTTGNESRAREATRRFPDAAAGAVSVAAADHHGTSQQHRGDP